MCKKILPLQGSRFSNTHCTVHEDHNRRANVIEIYGQIFRYAVHPNTSNDEDNYFSKQGATFLAL